MKIGVRIPCYRSWCRAEQIRRIAKTVEVAGFNSLWVQDHLVAPLGPTEDIMVEGVSTWLSEASETKRPTTLFEYYAGDDWWLDPYSVWGFLAALTERTKLASDIVVVPYRNPIVQAKMLGTLDVLSGGRMILGTGSGHVEAESRALGTEFGARGKVHDEYIKVIRCILSDEEASFDGEYYKFGPLRTLIRSVQQPCPPIFIGGNGPRAIRRAAELGDGWLPSAPDVGALSKGMAELERACMAAGRADRLPVAASLPNLLRMGTPNTPTGKRALHSPAQAIDVLCEFQAAGVSEVALGFPMPSESAYLDQIEFFAEHVLPSFDHHSSIEG